jgi:Uma2 family endonuclease
MALPKEKLLYTVEQYLEMERASGERHEYIDGYVYQMAGESLEHSAINANLIAMLVTQLRGKPCRALSPNMKKRLTELSSIHPPHSHRSATIGSTFVARRAGR